jgi:hypothetical protein
MDSAAISCPTVKEEMNSVVFVESCDDDKCTLDESARWMAS